MSFFDEADTKVNFARLPIEYLAIIIVVPPIPAGDFVRSPEELSVLFKVVDQENGRLLRSGIMDDVQVTADPNINALLVRAPAESMELIAALIEELDQLPDMEALIKVFTVVNSDATNLAGMLQSLFGQQVTAGQGNAQGIFGFQQQTQAVQTAGKYPPLLFQVVQTNLKLNPLWYFYRDHCKQWPTGMMIQNGQILR